MKNKKTEVRPGTTPRDVFFHLLAMIALYTGVISFIAILFQYINIKLPDLADYGYTSWDSIRQGSAAMIVVWPVFIGMSWLIYKDIRKDAKKQDTAIRKWLLYLTLLVSSITMIIDTVTLIYNFLGGELTLRFVLKVLVVLLVAGGVFGYYVWDIKRRGEKKTKLPRNLAIATSLMVIAVIIAGFFIIGTPSKQRALRFDQTRTQALQEIQYQIIDYWQRTESIPQTLEDLKTGPMMDYTMSTDPETQVPYEYHPTGENTFELCATFTTEQSQDPMLDRSYPIYGGVNTDGWYHQSGRTCFNRVIDPRVYPTYKSNENIIGEPDVVKPVPVR